jgi:hypothetical protein
VKPMFNFLKKKQSPQQIIGLLESVGFSFASEKAKNSVMEELAEFDGKGAAAVEAAMCCMGDEQFDMDTDTIMPWLSEDVWHFDFEAIEDHGAYVSIVNNCIRLSRGTLKMSDVTDYVDIEGGVAKVTFLAVGRSQEWNLEVDNDWADPQLFVKLNGFLDQSGSNKYFFKHDLGQDCLMICKTRAEVKAINSATGLVFWEFRN